MALRSWVRGGSLLTILIVIIIPMPARPKKLCTKAGCHKLTTTTRCEEHTKQRKLEHWRATDAVRPNATKRGYGSWWRRARLGFLKDNPLCVRCLVINKTEGATVVDHIEPHKGDADLFRNKDNWQALCKRCHDRKTAIEDSGFLNHNK